MENICLPSDQEEWSCVMNYKGTVIIGNKNEFYYHKTDTSTWERLIEPISFDKIPDQYGWEYSVFTSIDKQIILRQPSLQKNS